MLSAKQRIIFPVLVTISIGICLIAAMLQAGYERPIQSSDSHGHELGFLNPMTWELYGVLLKSATLTTVLQKLGGYGLWFIFFHLVAQLFFALNPKLKSNRIVAGAFLLQVFIFPKGLAGILMFPMTAYYFLTNTIDGEFLTDLP